MHRIVLIERDPLSYASWPSLIKKNRIPELSVFQVVDKYQGFEGDLVCYFEVSENLEELNQTLKSMMRLNNLGKCFILHVISTLEAMPSFLENQTIKVGYDVGVCEKEWTIYSSIFHEVIFGYYNELINYKNLLNENLLFPDRRSAEKYVELHNKMSAEGKDVEDYMEMNIYEIWRHKD